MRDQKGKFIAFISIDTPGIYALPVSKKTVAKRETQALNRRYIA